MPNKISYRAIEGAVIRQEGEEGRKLTFIASDGTRDAAGTVLNTKGWDLDRYNKNGVIGYQHKVYGSFEGTDNPDNVIGKGRAYMRDDKLMVDVEFEPAEINPLAEKIYQKLLFGSLNAVSVGFMSRGGKWGEGEEALTGKNPTYYYAGQELLEVSVVNIPSNPNAVKKSFIEEAIEAEMQELRNVAAQEPAPADPQPEPEPEPEPQDTKDIEGAQRQLDIATTIARAALL